ncbi:MAG: SWIM zinc finger family protein [Micromonosporaceae bacterium]|nr:SWIM zinc finger family protein [Micromonosporaceae bacterium]
MSWDRYYYPPSRPRKVDGGIKARGARGSIGESWWSRRFVDVIESFALGSRMTRGRSYARAGQVISLEVTAGVVTSRVQGSRARPYNVAIGLKPFPAAVWGRVEAALAGQALYSARLLAGDMPEDIEEVFSSAGVSLFPRSVRDLTMSCSCPDVAVPCKHLAATFYLLAEAFDADPFKILYWRGRARDDLLARLRELRCGDPAGGDPAGRDSVPEGAAADGAMVAGQDAGLAGQSPVGAALALAHVTVAPLAECLQRFWVAEQSLPAGQPPARRGLPEPAMTVETMPDLLLQQLPTPDQRIGGARLCGRLRPAYERFHCGGLTDLSDLF